LEYDTISILILDDAVEISGNKMEINQIFCIILKLALSLLKISFIIID